MPQNVCDTQVVVIISKNLQQSINPTQSLGVHLNFFFPHKSINQTCFIILKC